MDIPTEAKALLPVAGALAIAAATLAQPAIAASPEVLGALVKEAGAACQIASELEAPHVVWTNPGYEQKVAVMVAGTRKEDIEDGDAFVLCLFDKQSAKVEIQEMDPKVFE